MAKEEVVDTEREIYTQRKWHGRKNTFVSVILIIVLVTLGFYGFSWASSDIGGQKLSSFWYSVKTTYNPFYWYGEQLKGAQSFGDVLSTEQNKTAEKIGIKFQAFESIGGKIIPSGAPIALNYKLDVGEGVNNVPLTLECRFKGERDDKYSDTVERTIIDQESKKFQPTEKPIISIENPLSYSNIICQALSQKQSSDKIIIAEGTISFPIEHQRNSLKVYFTKDTTNIGKKFFEKEGLKEKLPILSKYNNEPIELGIGVSDENIQPVIIDHYPAIKITLKNSWDGKVTKIKSLDLILPQGVSIDKERNANPHILCPFDEFTSTGKYVRYSAKESYLAQIPEFGKGLETQLETYKKVFCYLKIEDSILEGKPYNDKGYNVDISYEYKLSPRTETITLKKPMGEEGTTTTTETKYYLCKDKTTGQYSCETSCASNCEGTCEAFDTQQKCETDKTLYQGTI